MLIIESIANAISKWYYTFESKKLKNGKKKSRLCKGKREEVWEFYMGNVIRNKCYCCSRNEISVHNFEAGHVIAESRGGATTIKNLRPLCSQCNKSMGTKNLYEFMFRNGWL